MKLPDSSWVDELCACRCGSRPIFAGGMNPEAPDFLLYSGFITCRTPEKHDLLDNFAVIGAEGSAELLCDFLTEMWDNLNFRGERPS